MSIKGLKVETIAEKIINGYRLKRDDELSFLLTSPLEELEKAAGLIQKHFFQNQIELCTIINAKSGRCSENCKYCAQSVRYKTECEVYPFLTQEKILAQAKDFVEAGINRCALVTAARSLNGEDFEKALACYKEMKKETNLALCASMGLLKPEQFQRLREAGVSRYHNNIETSRNNFPNICTTHCFDEKISAIKAAQEAGLLVCSGGILGMGESFADRIDMALELSELGVDSIPLNFLIPIPGTPLEKQEQISEEDAMRSIAIFRFINPTANIRLAAGRKIFSDFGAKAFLSGASSTITGDMLTTSGTTIMGDMKIIEANGQVRK